MSDVTRVLQDVAELMQPRIDDAQVTLTLTQRTPIPQSLFDADALHRAVLNIVTNALDALDGSENGQVEIRSGFNPDSEQLWIEIEDNGPGIDEAEIPRLFTLFESTKGFKGTGLGLAVSRKILQEHGGTIDVHTKAGVGTCFRLEWPYSSDEIEPHGTLAG
jgi:signal transduction histidine kinase